VKPDNDPDVIHVSPWLVKTIGTLIVAGLTAVGSLQVAWIDKDKDRRSVEDAFRATQIERMTRIQDDIAEIKKNIQIVPTNTQKLADHERRLDHLEQDMRSRSE
jgi:type II restriction/modification system DNA methylase subunit YeeA